jgi:hypothetical protein
VSRNTLFTDFVETLGRKSSCNTHISNKLRLGTSEHVLKMMKPIGENLDYCMTGRVIPTFLLWNIHTVFFAVGENVPRNTH